MALSELTQSQKNTALFNISNSDLDGEIKDLLTVLVNEASTIEGSIVYELGTANFTSNMKQVYNYAAKNGIRQIDSLKQGAHSGETEK